MAKRKKKWAGYNEFDEHGLVKFKKKVGRKGRKIGRRLGFIGLCTGLLWIGHHLISMPIYDYVYNPCTKKIAAQHSREDIEKIVKENDSVKRTLFSTVNSIKFSTEADPDMGCHDRWLSMQESYAMRKGDCMEGAIIFVANLSDNPEYDARLICLDKKWADDEAKSGHTIAVYKDGEKWKYVSFNEPIKQGVRGGLFSNIGYDTLEEAIKEYSNGRFYKWAEANFTPEELKFGRALQEKSNDLTWNLIKK